MCVARGMHLVLLVLAALVCVEYVYICVLWGLERTWCCQFLLHSLVVCVGYMCSGAWSAPGAVSAYCTCRIYWLYVLWCERTWCSQCLLHLSYVLAICVVVLGAHLVLSVLAALIYMLAICEVGCLARTSCKRGVALVKF